VGLGRLPVSGPSFPPDRNVAATVRSTTEDGPVPGVHVAPCAAPDGELGPLAAVRVSESRTGSIATLEGESAFLAGESARVSKLFATPRADALADAVRAIRKPCRGGMVSDNTLPVASLAGRFLPVSIHEPLHGGDQLCILSL